MIEVLAKISSMLYFIIKYILQKKCILLKKITGWIDLQYKIIITKYLNIAIAFHQTRAYARGCSTKWFISISLLNQYFIAIIYMRLWVFKRHFSTIFQLYIDI
jgi:hypothetical protein